MGIIFFAVLAGLWQLLHHADIHHVKDLFTANIVKDSYDQMSTYEMGVFFSVFVMLQFWNLFNAKYYSTGRSLMLDLVDLFKKPAAVKNTYSRGFIVISLTIVLGQIFIVSVAGRMFNVSPLAVGDWLWILLLTAPVLVLGDLVRTVKIMVRRLTCRP